jgi:hypothetical protein
VTLSPSRLGDAARGELLRALLTIATPPHGLVTLVGAKKSLPGTVTAYLVRVKSREAYVAGPETGVTSHRAAGSRTGVAAASVRKISLAYCTQCRPPWVRTDKNDRFRSVGDNVAGTSAVRSAPGPQRALRMSSSCSSGTSRDLASLARFPSRDCSRSTRRIPLAMKTSTWVRAESASDEAAVAEDSGAEYGGELAFHLRF